MRDAVVAAYVAHEGEADRIRPLIDAFVHAATDDPRVAQLAFVQAAGVSARVEAHRRATRNAFIAGIEAIGRDLLAVEGVLTDDVLEQRPGPRPRRNAVAVVGAIIEMAVDWLHDPAPDPVDRLIDDIAHFCRGVEQRLAIELRLLGDAAAPDPSDAGGERPGPADLAGSPEEQQTLRP